MKCKPYSKIKVEIWTQLKTVKITSNIFAVCICFCRQETSHITWSISCIFITTYNNCNEFYVGKSGRANTVIVQAAYTNMHMYSPNTYAGTSNWGKILSEVYFYAFAFSPSRYLPSHYTFVSNIEENIFCEKQYSFKKYMSPLCTSNIHNVRE